MPTQSLAQPRTLKELTSTLVKQLAAGTSQELLISQLVERGWPAVSARQFIANVAQTASQHNDVDEERENDAAQFRSRIVRDLIMGLICFGLMLLSMSFFEGQDMLALFFFGMSVYAFVDMLVAFIGYTHNRR
ncbi:MAG: hypothetical protein M1434_00350 [Chloroflexi bacterium]|nr:hypothetical protein [Chloroflexota bacterium]MCL5273185.1 hypothetical protein [Chloroflexota bacterium]